MSKGAEALPSTLISRSVPTVRTFLAFRVSPAQKGGEAHSGWTLHAQMQASVFCHS